MKLWSGRLKGDVNELLNDLNASIGFDSRMIVQDITGSIAHATMLGEVGVITPGESAQIVEGLKGILADVQSGALPIDMTSEDVHTFVEAELTKRIGAAGKKLHTGRSRNDQVALDVRMYLAAEIDRVTALTEDLIAAFTEVAERHRHTVMPGYTHLQRAQPVTLHRYLDAYVQMLRRDVERLGDCKKRTLVMPLGSGALAGTTYPLNRRRVCELLGFNDITKNTMDAVSDRDFALELLSDLSILMMHLSRFSEEICLWCSWEFRFVTLADEFSTGSSIMPQKKNPDVTELIRGKTGRVYGDLNTLLVMMKGIPLAYDKDMQEDKEAIFDAVDTLELCLRTVTPMLATMTPLPANMRRAAAKGFINATDCADYLTKKGMPFRDAYKCTGTMVAACIREGKTLEELTLDEFKQYSDLFAEDVYTAIDLTTCCEGRTSYGGPTKASVLKQIELVKEKLA